MKLKDLIADLVAKGQLDDNDAADLATAQRAAAAAMTAKQQADADLAAAAGRIAPFVAEGDVYDAGAGLVVTKQGGAVVVKHLIDPTTVDVPDDTGATAAPAGASSS